MICKLSCACVVERRGNTCQNYDTVVWFGLVWCARMKLKEDPTMLTFLNAAFIFCSVALVLSFKIAKGDLGRLLLEEKR